jgi:restriction system protein
MPDKTMPLREAAASVLCTGGPKHYEALTVETLARGLASSESKTPAASVNAMIAVDIKRNGAKSEFIRVRPGVFGLRTLHAASATLRLTPDEVLPRPDGSTACEAKRDESEQRVRTPLFPTYSEVRHLLMVWPGRPRKQVTGLHAALGELRGAPQKHHANRESSDSSGLIRAEEALGRQATSSASGRCARPCRGRPPQPPS